MNQPTRLSLLNQIQDSQSDEAWQRFYAMYHQLVSRWLAREGLQPADVDDLSQDVMTTVFSEIENFRHNGRVGAFRRWLRKIVANRLNRKWEKKSTRERHEAKVNFDELAQNLADDQSHLSRLWDHQHDKHILNQLLETLANRFSERHIQVFRRVAVAEEDARHVAEDLGMTLGAVRVAQHRVLRALKELAGAILD